MHLRVGWLAVTRFALSVARAPRDELMGRLASPFLQEDRQRSSNAQLLELVPELREHTAASSHGYRAAFSRDRSSCPTPLMPPPVVVMGSRRRLAVTSSEPFLCAAADGALPAGVPGASEEELEPYLFGPHAGGKLQWRLTEHDMNAAGWAVGCSSSADGAMSS